MVGADDQRPDVSMRVDLDVLGLALGILFELAVVWCVVVISRLPSLEMIP